MTISKWRPKKRTLQKPTDMEKQLPKVSPKVFYLLWQDCIFDFCEPKIEQKFLSELSLFATFEKNLKLIF